MRNPTRFLKGVIFTLFVYYITTGIIGILSISGNIPDSSTKVTKRRRIIIGNWKSLGNRKMISSFIHSALNSDEFKEISIRSDIVVAPPMINMQMFQSAPVILAAQDISRYPSRKRESGLQIKTNNELHENGPMTGEITSSLLIDNQIKMVLVGHSEQRRSGISDSVISDKLRNALSSGLGVIYCVGHVYNNKENNNNKESDTIPNNFLSMEKDQPWVSLIQQMGILCDTVSDILFDNNPNIKINIEGDKHKRIQNLNEKEKLLLSDKIIIAYEPSAAIGKNIIINKKEITDIGLSIRSFMRGCGLREDVIRVIYGGGVDENSCKDLSEVKVLDGVIVGRSALQFDRFINILRCLEIE